MPDTVVWGNAPGSRKLRRRTSAGSISTSAANRSTARSMAEVASGRPAPRKAPLGVVVVGTDTARNPAEAMSYTPVNMAWVMRGKNPAMSG